MGQCCSCATDSATAVPAVAQPQSIKQEGVEVTRLTAVAAFADTPVAARSPSVVSLTPSSTEKRHRSVAASPTRFFELLAEPSAKVRTELLMKASMEYQASGDLGPLQPDTPQNSVRSLLNALLLKQAPNQDAMLLQDMCGDAWIQKSSLTNWQPLGEGAFATVQQCMLKQDAGALVPVAVKKLKPHVINNAIDLREFLSEANTLRRLKHRHIVEFKGVGCMEPQTPESMTSSLYIVQEFMSGDTLKVHVLHQMFPSNSSPVAATYTWLDAFRWLHQIATALKYLHCLRPMVVHRDLKLENMLLTGIDPAAADAKLADFGLCKLVKDTAGAVPFVPGTPGGSSVGQGPSAVPQSPLLPPMSNLRSTPFDWGPPTGSAPGPVQGEASRGTDGQAVGSTPLHPHRGDDSAKAGPSQGYPSSSDCSSQRRGLQTDAGSRLSTVVFPTALNSAASSGHRTPLAAGGFGASNRLGQLSYAAANDSEGTRAGQLPSAQKETGAGRFQNALSSGNTAGRAPVGPHDLAAVSHADGGKKGLLVVPGQNFKPFHLSESHDAEQEVMACSNQYGANGQHGVAELSQLQLPDAASMTHAAADTAATQASLHNQEGRCHDSELQRHQQTQSAAMAQPLRLANANSGKSASGVVLSPVSSAGHRAYSNTVSSPESDAARASEQVESDPRHSAAAFGQQAQPEGSSLQQPLATDQTALSGAGSAKTRGQPEAAPGPGPGMHEAEQRNVEEQEVLYNMTGQTGSLMYMAPEVLKGQSYNEKVDVFSFAIIIFELLSSRVAMAAIANRGDLDYETVHAHAEETANGFRLPIPVDWPAPVRSLIEDCWAQKSSKRPSFATIERRLEEIKASGVIDEYLAAKPRHALKPSPQQSGCLIS